MRSRSERRSRDLEFYLLALQASRSYRDLQFIKLTLRLFRMYFSQTFQEAFTIRLPIRVRWNYSNHPSFDVLRINSLYAVAKLAGYYETLREDEKISRTLG